MTLTTAPAVGATPDPSTLPTTTEEWRLSLSGEISQGAQVLLGVGTRWVYPSARIRFGGKSRGLELALSADVGGFPDQFHDDNGALIHIDYLLLTLQPELGYRITFARRWSALAALTLGVGIYGEVTQWSTAAIFVAAFTPEIAFAINDSLRLGLVPRAEFRSYSQHGTVVVSAGVRLTFSL